MNVRTPLFLLVQGVTLLSVPLHAADLNALVAEAARYESGQSAEALREIEQKLCESVGNVAQRQELEQALIRLLAPSATFEARRFACRQLAIYGKEASLPALAALFESPDTVGMACLALSTHPLAGANEVLREALATTSASDRGQVMLALGERRDALSVPALTKLARDADSTTAAAAIAALGKIAGEGALRSLSSLRRSSDAQRVHGAVMASLTAADRAAETGSISAAGEVYEELLASSQSLHVRRAALEGMLRVDADGGLKRVLALLHGSDVLLRPSAIARVASLRGSEVSKRFADKLSELDPNEQVLLIESLAARSDRDARAAIKEQVFATSPTVRRTAIRALAYRGDAAVDAVLIEALRTFGNAEDQRVISMALSNLGGHAEVDESIIAALRNSSNPLRAVLIDVLRQRRSRIAIQALLDEAGSPNGVVAKEAFQALGELASSDVTTQLVQRLVDLQAPSARQAAKTAVAKVLAQIPDSGRRSAIMLGPLTQAEDAETRCSLIGLLHVCGDTQALEGAKAALQSADPRIRDAALRTLLSWPNGAAWNPLAQVYRQPATPREHRLALQGLVRLAHTENASPTADLIDRYRELLRHARDDADLKLILSALAGCAHPDALTLALPLRGNVQVRAEAEMAIRKIAKEIGSKHREGARIALKQLE